MSPNVNNGVAYSAPNPKDDSEAKAYVRTTQDNLIPEDVFWYRVVATADKNREACTGFKRITPVNVSSVTLSYYSGYAWTGALRCLEADTDNLYVHVSGYWFS